MDTPKRGRPFDAEGRRIARDLRKRIDASPYSVRQLAFGAGLTQSEYRSALQAMRGVSGSRAQVRRIAARLDSLTPEPTDV